jgi:transcriptional regulator with XRE-family HTH domain
LRKPSLAVALRLEIRRLANRELQKAMRPLRRMQRQLKVLRQESREHRRGLTGVDRRMGRLRDRMLAQRRFGPPGRRGRPLSGSSIRLLRERLRMTREQFAGLLKVSAGSIFGWESGRTVPRNRSLERVQELRKMGVKKARALGGGSKVRTLRRRRVRRLRRAGRGRATRAAQAARRSSRRRR